MRIPAFILLSALLYCCVQSGPVASKLESIEHKLEENKVNMRDVIQSIQQKFAQIQDGQRVARETSSEEQPVDEVDVKKVENEKKEVDTQLEDERKVDAEHEKKEVESQLDEEKKVEHEKKEVEGEEKVENEKKEVDSQLEDEKKVEVEQTKEEHKRVVARSIESTNTTEWEQNPCQSNQTFNYFQPHPREETKYIECDPWGTGVVKSCEKGLIWNAWEFKCDQKENIKNMTWSFVPQPQTVFNCSLVGYECMNGGVCSESPLGGVRCVCKKDYTGQFCESRVDMNDLTHAILNGTFSIHDYVEQLSQLNVSQDASEYVRYKDQLDNVTYEELSKYLSMFKKGEVRYDIVANTLVENILEDIYPDAAYLSSFNASAVSVVELVRIIPNLLSYSKYSFERYADVFAKYQQVLTRLTEYMNSTTHAPRCRENAKQYAHLTAVFMNQTMAQLNQTYSNSENVEALLQSEQANQQHVQMNETQVRDLLREQYNATLQASEKLMATLEKFQMNVQKAIEEKSVDVARLTLGEVKLEGAQEVRALLESIQSSSAHIWDSLVNYGFWFITTFLATPVEQLNQTAASATQAQKA